MKSLLQIISFLIIFSSCNIDKDPVVDPDPKDSISVDTTQYYGIDYIYDIKGFPVINLVISTKQWNQLLSNYDMNPNNEEYIASNFSFTKNKKIADEDQKELQEKCTMH